MDLKQYEQEKFAMAEILRSAEAVDTKDGQLRSAVRDLQARLADDRFNLMLLGRFNRGKSTLINALLGGAYLPTGILPLTSVITTVRYGSRKQVVLNFSGSRLRREVPLVRLPEYVTQQANPGNVKNVDYAEIELPVEILRRGVFFVDSPGLGSAIAENTRTTERFFPEADAFVLITSYESPLSEEEIRALQRIRETNKTVFVVVNKQDTASDAERSQVLDYVRSKLVEFAFQREPNVFSVSARLGLEGRLEQDEALTSNSGMGPFEAELFRFLTEERAEAFIQMMHRRVGDFLEHQRNLAGGDESQAVYGVLLERFEGSGPNTVDQFACSERRQLLQPDSRLQLEFEKRSGCQICGEVLDAVFHFLSKYQYELTISEEAQRDHATRGGFCQLHTWQFENLSSPYGVCTAYPALASRIASNLGRFADVASGQDWSLGGVGWLLSGPATCRVCQVRIESERAAVERAAAKVKEAKVASQRRFPACCLPHLAATTRVLGRGLPSQELLLAHSKFLERLAEDAQRYALRHDALRRHLTSEEERSASQLLLLMLTGHRSLCAPWHVEHIFV